MVRTTWQKSAGKAAKTVNPKKKSKEEERSVLIITNIRPSLKKRCVIFCKQKKWDMEDLVEEALIEITAHLA